MENQRNESEFPDNSNIKTEPIDMNIQDVADLVEIKRGPDIKLEPDDVDTIEYTITSNQMEGIFVPKVEKVEPGDEQDMADEGRPLLNLLENHDLFNSISKTKLTGETNTQDTNRTYRMENRLIDKSNGANQPSGSHPRDIDGRKILSTPTMKTTMDKFSGKVGPASKKISKGTRGQLKCSECDYVTTISYYLKRHMRKHTGDKPFACKSCLKSFQYKQSLQSHMKTHVSKNTLNCSICWEIFATEIELMGHESACQQRWYECHLCKKFSTTKISNFTIHMRVHSGERPYKCDHCSIKFARKDHLNGHMKTHTKPHPLKFRCSVCARTFLEQSQKDAHELNCNYRRYECYLCHSYMIHLKLLLQNHMRMQHTGERPFKCNFCEKDYADKSHFNRHVKRVHKQ